MTNEERKEVVVALAAVAEIMGQEATKERLQGIVLLVDDLPSVSVLAAIREIAKTSDWLPKPREIREATNRMARDRIMTQPQLDEAPATEAEKKAVKKAIDETRRSDGTVDFHRAQKAVAEVADALAMNPEDAK